MELVYFALVAIPLYLFSDWLLGRIEIKLGRRLEHRTLVFFVILMALALGVFTLIGHLDGG